MPNINEYLEELKSLAHSPKLVAVHSQKKVLANGAYVAEDVVSEDITTALGATPWSFPGMAKTPGGGGWIVGGLITAETTAIASWFTLFLHIDAPTCVVSDGIPNTAPILADRTIYVGRIDFPACSGLGTNEMSETMATPSTVGNLPMPFVCQHNSSALYGVLVIRNAVDLAANTWLRIALNVDQH